MLTGGLSRVLIGWARVALGVRLFCMNIVRKYLVQCCNIFESYTLFQDGFNCEQARLIKENVMLLKFKITNYVILLLIGLFLFPPSIKALDRIEQAEDRFGCSEGMSANEVRHCSERKVFYLT
jgi:hypothetical protein